MKKTVRVVIEKEFEIDIPDVLLTPQHIKEFDSFIGLNADVDDVEECRNELFQFVARHAANDWEHADGMGYLGSEYRKKYMDNPEEYIVTENTYDDIETDFV